MTTHLRRLRATAPLKRVHAIQSHAPRRQSPSPPGDGPIEAIGVQRSDLCTGQISPSPPGDGPIEAVPLGASPPYARKHLRRLRATAPLKPPAQTRTTTPPAPISVASGRRPH